MVINSTSATEVSIQAVSPELGMHFSSTAFFGSGSLAQATGAASATGAAAAGAAAGAGAAACCAWAKLSETKTTNAASGNSHRARAKNERRVMSCKPPVRTVR
jgi:hypothetical protein